MRLAVLLVLACIALSISSCSDDSAGGEPTHVDGPATLLTVTRDFGHEVLASDEVAMEPRDTLLRQLRREHDVKAGPGGEWIETIDGLEIKFPAPEEEVWATNVNGIETDVLPNRYRVFDGDVIQWDYRYWETRLDVRATVGAFPETFTRGVFGKRFPVTVQCLPKGGRACDRVKAAFRRAGVPTDGTSRRRSDLPPPGNPQRAKVLVGRWQRLRDEKWPRWIDRGAEHSGVFAEFGPDASTLRLLDRKTDVVRSEGPGTGLVAALRPTEEDLLWVITGVDDAGVERAARALTSDELRNAFAAAVTSDGIEKLPIADQ